ncbi:hypothetical protein [uncultured Thalassospira sp.]|uniref:hypothetical protein n=1 Tax=uncultured Thalassospira sp. TaxID=404382 RepID=UPI0030DB3E12|tara:strand:- start:853 stop:1122 length:270 start_codon:yes stop_codon:yes gene_type:complete
MPNIPTDTKTNDLSAPQKWQGNLKDAMQALRGRRDPRFEILLEQGSMSVEVYAPDKIDHQTPHRKDELYIIQSESGIFYRGDTHKALFL